MGICHYSINKSCLKSPFNIRLERSRQQPNSAAKDISTALDIKKVNIRLLEHSYVPNQIGTK
jgi:hypothetical protein